MGGLTKPTEFKFNGDEGKFAKEYIDKLLPFMPDYGDFSIIRIIKTSDLLKLDQQKALHLYYFIRRIITSQLYYARDSEQFQDSIFLTDKGREAKNQESKANLVREVAIKNVENIDKKTTKMKDVFVTYSWDSEKHNDAVTSFTDFLRKKGFVAENDILVSQKESTMDFYKMMHRIMTDYKKVIIVLSKGYKEKAEAFKGGVGNEFALILKDIDKNTNKYILVSFEPISDEIAPLALSGRHTIDLSVEKNLNELFAKLNDEEITTFSEVEKNKPEIDKKIIKPFEVKTNNLEIGDLVFNIGGTNGFARLITKIDFGVSVELKNNTNESFSDYTFEVSYPVNSIDQNISGRNLDDFKIVTYDSNPKIYSNQTKSIKLERILISNRNAAQIIISSIKIKLYTEKGLVEKMFPLKGALKDKSDYGTDEILSLDKFQDPNYG